jgi:hypothetical protein
MGEMSESRRHLRIQYAHLAFVSWKTFDGRCNHVLGKFLDVSERGVKLEVSTQIPAGSFVQVRADGLNLASSATVRRVARQESGYVLGLELTARLDPNVLAELRASQPEMAAA